MVPVTVKSLLTVKESWMVVGEEMMRGVAESREETEATLISLADKTESVMRLDKVWMALAVCRVLGSVRVK